jgi:hypothetical protein
MGQVYTGFTEDLRQRLEDHNAGKSTHTKQERKTGSIALPFLEGLPCGYSKKGGSVESARTRKACSNRGWCPSESGGNASWEK